jgi:hypothetical protein
VQGGYAGAERVSIGETESDADPYGGEVLVEPLRAANAHADAQNASEPRTAAAQQVAWALAYTYAIAISTRHCLE